MHGSSLKLQAFLFAACLGAVSFCLAAFSGYGHAVGGGPFVNAAIIAVVCAVLSWGAADRLLLVITESVNAAVTRLAAATAGDLDSPTPDQVSNTLPKLSNTIDELFSNVRTNIESANSLALFDQVTALPNRLHFRNEVDALMKQPDLSPSGALFFIDLDNFKAVNDNLGHAAGDQLLIMVANRLRGIAQVEPLFGTSLPVIGRLAGDEFTVFVAHVADEKAIKSFAKAIIRTLASPFSINGQVVQIGGSVGVARWPEHGDGLTTLMRAADVAMYEAKAQGRGQFRFYTDALATQLADRVRLDSEIRDALDNGEFGFVFQPQTDLRTGHTSAAEALVRWHHPVEGVRLPASFLAAAEENGMIVELGEWTLGAVAATIARWNETGHRHRLSINVSARQFAGGDFVKRTKATMAKANAPMELLEIEISERFAMDMGEGTLADLAALRALGAKISIDNFGKGFSNITRLRTMPVDRVKIDWRLTSDVATDPEARAIVHGLVNMLHGIGKEVVAEGVENADQLAVLKVIGCDAAQGYAIARPMEEKLLNTWAIGPVKQRKTAQ
jgi:diguanylate cyclase